MDESRLTISRHRSGIYFRPLPVDRDDVHAAVAVLPIVRGWDIRSDDVHLIEAWS